MRRDRVRGESADAAAELSMRKQILVPFLVSLFLSLGAGSTALAGVTVEKSLSQPASVVTDATAEGCENNPGPFVTLNGELTLGGLGARLIFRNNEQGTHEHEEDVNVDITILEAGRKITLAKQPPEGGVGGNPHIFLQFYDGDWKALGKPKYLGRCVQGLKGAAQLFTLPTDATVVLAGECSNSGGPNITLTGELTLGGLNGKLIFSNSKKLGPHVADAPVEVKFTILAPGESITFAKQPPLDGAGGNPRVYLQFLDGEGDAIGNELYVGRCVQLN
jgi:hypothetical protein